MKNKLLHLMKMGLYFSLLGFVLHVVTLSAVHGISATEQSVKSVKDVYLSIEFDNLNVFEAFELIEANTNYRFAFERKMINQNVRIKFKASDKSLADILTEISKLTNLKFRQVDNSIDVKNITEKESKVNRVEIITQNKKVSGRVISFEDKEGLPGVNVVEKGTTNGTITDVEGIYTLNVAEGATLVFSSVGFTTEEVAIGARSVVDVSMLPDVKQLEEIVVVGYGQQSEITTTGAITSIGGDEIERTSAPTIAEAIIGAAPGLSSVQATGQPGQSDPQLYLRGISTLNSSQPLVIIDGVPSDMRAFMQLNPSSISSLSILKDASSTAVYGVRGANGAIIVETRRGEKGKAKIQADFSYGLQVPTDLPEYANAYEWALSYNETVTNDGTLEKLIPERILNHYKNQDIPLIFPDQNWVDLAFGNAAMQSRSNINISGGTDKVRYFSSLGYFKQDGLLKFDNNTGNFTYDRINVQNNIDLDLTKSTLVKFTSSARIGVSRTPRTSMTDFWRNANTAGPIAGAGIVDGKVVLPKIEYTPWLSEQHTLVTDIYGKGNNRDIENRLNINLDLKQKLDVISPVLEGLEFRTKIGYSDGFDEEIEYNAGGFATYRSVFNMDLNSPDPNLADSAVVLQKLNDPGAAYWDRDYEAERSFYLEGGLDYNRTFGRKHNVNALLIYTQSKDYYPGGQYSNIPNGTVGVAGRVRYDYNQKYILEYNLGYNGSENFHRDRRFGWFPSASIGWVLSEENFIRELKIFDLLKLRASYGKVGSDQTQGGARFIYIGDLYNRDPHRSYGYNFGNNIPEFLPGVQEAGLGNPNITWETAVKQNYGLEFEVLDSRLSFIGNYFYEYRNDILMTRKSDPTWLSVTLPPVNIGEMENKGYEIQLGWKDKVGGFVYNIDANVAHAKNKVLFMDEVPPREAYQTETGHPLGTTFGYVWERFYTPEDIEKIANGELPKPTAISNPQPGDMMYKDLNGDMIIDNADQKPFGFPERPQLTGGLNIYMAYKGFDLNMGFQGAAQVSRNVGNVFKDPFGLTDQHAVLKTFHDYAWSLEKYESGAEIKWPRHTFANDNYNQYTSTFWNMNSSYIRLRRAELGYTFNRLTRWMSQARIYISGNNLLTFNKKYTLMMDPERSPGQTTGYPLIKLYNVGFNVTF